MKRYFIVLTVLLAMGLPVLAQQPVNGKKFELGAGMSLDSFSSGVGGTATYLNIPVRAGYFVWKGLEIEPELILSKMTGGDLGWLFNGNAAYNFRLKNGKFVPFVLAGVGFGNGIKIFNTMIENSDDLDAVILNAGTGVKYLISDSVGFRFEYRYSHYWADVVGNEGDKIKFEKNAHQILCGVSVFF